MHTTIETLHAPGAGMIAHDVRSSQHRAGGRVSAAERLALAARLASSDEAAIDAVQRVLEEILV